MAIQVWRGAEVVTMDPDLPRARAIVARDGIVDYVGDEEAALARARDLDRGGASAPPVVRDLGGRAVVPGFNDNHVHAVFMGDHVLTINLGGLGAEEIVALLRERFPDPRPGLVLRAFNWDYPACPDPRKELLDEAFPRNPVILNQFWPRPMAQQRRLARAGDSPRRSRPQGGQRIARRRRRAYGRSPRPRRHQTVEEARPRCLLRCRHAGGEARYSPRGLRAFGHHLCTGQHMVLSGTTQPEEEAERGKP